MGQARTPENRANYYKQNKDKWPKWETFSEEKKERLKQYQRDYRIANRQLISTKQKEKRLEKQVELIKFLGGKCSKCFGVFDPVVYDFHHKNPQEKEFTIGEYMGFSLSKLKVEAEKCELLCANCHRLVHKEAA